MRQPDEPQCFFQKAGAIEPAPACKGAGRGFSRLLGHDHADPFCGGGDIGLDR